MRTDVKSYYASIDHLLLMDRLAIYVKDRDVLNLLGQYLRRISERGGWFWEGDGGETVTPAAQFGLDCHGLEGYRGNVG